MGLAVLLATAACGAEATGRKAGCVAPPNEDALLDDYARDPMLAVTPHGAARVGGVTRSRACIRLNREDVSETSVTVHLQPSRDVDAAALGKAYEAVAARHGWSPERIPERPTAAYPPGDVYLSYCRLVRAVTSVVVINVQPAMVVDVRPSDLRRPSAPAW